MQIQSSVKFSTLLLLCACGGAQQVPSTTYTVSTGNPNLLIEQNLIDFGELALNSVKSQSVVIYNVGDDILVVSDIQMDEPFTTDAVGELEIQPDSSTPITIKYNPTLYEASSGSLTITSNDPDTPEVVISVLGSVITDSDKDGFDSLDAGGEDCNDDDANIYPGAPDEWYDGLDSDCAGNDDYDQDQDGYQTIVWSDDPTTGGDCQDANPDMYPGAPDEWYDGVDSDCAGNDDYDKDGDGSRSAALGRGTDCDDEDPEVNTLAVEVINGLDENCDGRIDNDVAGWNTEIVYEGSDADDMAGFSMTTGDLNGDGKDDLIVGSPGYNTNRGLVTIFSGNTLPTTGSTITDGQNDFSGDSAGNQAGFYVGVLDDFDDTAVPTLLVGAPTWGPSSSQPNRGKLYFIAGDDAFYGGDLDDAYLTISGTSTNFIGQGFSQDLDLNGDGLNDVLGTYVNGSNQYLWLLYGDATLGGDINHVDTDVQFTTGASLVDENLEDDDPLTIMHRSFPNGGDLNGDGLDDALYCSSIPTHNYQNSQGSVWVLWGQDAQYDFASLQVFGTLQTNGNTFGVADVVVTGNNQHRTGEACAIGPDWDGDGDAELWVFNPGAQNVDTGVYLIPGGPQLEGSIYKVTQAYTHYFSTRGTNPVTGIRNVGDWDGDGKGEIGIAFGTTSETDAGQAWIISSQFAPGSYNGGSTVSNIEGDIDQNQVHFGNSLPSRPGDLDGDGNIDWIVSDWGYTGSNGSSVDKGAIYINYQQ